MCRHATTTRFPCSQLVMLNLQPPRPEGESAHNLAIILSQDFSTCDWTIQKSPRQKCQD